MKKRASVLDFRSPFYLKVGDVTKETDDSVYIKFENEKESLKFRKDQINIFFR
jgi:hypothetical protein